MVPERPNQRPLAEVGHRSSCSLAAQYRCSRQPYSAICSSNVL